VSGVDQIHATLQLTDDDLGVVDRRRHPVRRLRRWYDSERAPRDARLYRVGFNYRMYAPCVR
jgi:hypothetical protein